MISRLPVWLLLAAALALPARGAESNAWPFLVTHDDGADAPRDYAEFGPFAYSRVDPDGHQVHALRPLFLYEGRPGDDAAYVLYPLFTWRTKNGFSSFSIFNLANGRREPATGTKPATRGFDLWPVYFSRNTGDAATSYQAVFPVGGTILNRFGRDRISWAPWPLFVQSETKGRRITSVPWPFVRIIEGAGHHGFELWPLAGERGRAGDYRDQFFLWPLFYRHEAHLSAPQPDVSIGVLPFYAQDTGPGYLNENFLWPLFGFTHRTEPARYDENRYLWPFLVQGRGDGRYVNRWGPVYTHSVIKGYDKTWVLWPLWRHATWTEAGLAQEQNRLLWVVYWSLEQRDPRRPQAGTAYKKHLWPLFSAWDNGAGRRQFQLLSPLEVFFPDNAVVRQVYSPLFALYRTEQRAPGDKRGSFLWGLVSWRNTPADQEFHLGPLLSERAGAGGDRIALLCGVLSWHRDPGSGRWHFFPFDFTSRSVSKAPGAPSSP